MDIDQIQSEWERDSEIPKVALDETSRKTPNLHAKYSRLLTRARLHARNLEIELKALKSRKMAWYKGYLTKQEMDTLGWSYDPFQGRKPLKNELEDELVRDPDVISMTQQYTYYTELAGFLDAAVSHIQWRHQTIRNMIDWRKFEAGE